MNDKNPQFKKNSPQDEKSNTILKKINVGIYVYIYM